MFNNLEKLSETLTVHYRVKYDDIGVDNTDTLEQWEMKELLLAHFKNDSYSKLEVTALYLGVEYVDFELKYSN